MILPERVLGRSAAKMMSSGLAMAPIFLATWSFNSAMSTSLVGVPSFTVTNAQSAWPLISCTRPTTAASATCGWSTRALSTSIVPIRCPATFSTSSTRPSTQKKPSASRLAPSPVK